MASLFEETIRVLSKPSSTRTDHECRALVPWLRQLSPLLEPHAIDVLIDFIRNCRYQRAATDHVLIWRGKFTQSYYLIVKGSVSLYVDGAPQREDVSPASAHPSTDPDIGDISASGAPRSASSTGRPPPAEPTTGDAVTGFRDGEKKLGQRPKLGKFIISYGAGDSLFDCSVIFDVKPVGVTAICDKTTHLLLLGNDFVSDDLREILQQEILQMRSVVQSHPLFSTIPQRLQSLVGSCLRQERFTFDSIVVQQGNPVEKIFFIRSGQAKILVESARHQYQYPHLWPFEIETDVYAQECQWLRESRRASLSRKYINPAMTSIKNHQVTVRRKEGYAGVEKWLKDRVISLCTVSSGEVLGDIEISLGLPTYLQTVRTLHHMTVYSLHMNGLERIIGRLSEQEAYGNEALGDRVHRKLENRMNAKYGQQVPLLKCLYGVLNEALMKKNNLSTKDEKAPKRNDGGKNILPDLRLPSVNRRSGMTNKQSTESGPTASYPAPLTFSEKRFGQHRAPGPSVFERIHGGGQECSSDHNGGSSISPRGSKNQSIFERLHGGWQGDGSEPNGEGSSSRRTKRRRRATRSVLQVREAIQLKIAEDKFTNSQCVWKKGRGAAKRQMVANKTILNNEFNSAHGKASLTPPMASVDSTGSDLVMTMSEEQPNDSNGASKINRNQLPGISTKDVKEKDPGILQDESGKTKDNSIGKINIHPNSLTSSKTRLKPHCNQQDQCLTTKLPPVPEEFEPIQFQPLPTLPCSTNSTELVNNSSHATEKKLITSKDPDNSNTLHFGRAEATEIAIDREEMLGGMLEENKDDVKRIQDLGFNNDRPSKPKLSVISAKGGNYESSNHFLCDLEERMRQFHQENLDSQYKYTLKLPSLKRYEEIGFEVDGETYDGPRPGGRVLIRKRKCRFQGFFALVKDHKHTHYHMVDSIPSSPIIDPYKRTKNM